MMGEPDKGEITKVFEAIRDGAKDAQDRLFSLVYDELHRIAHGRMSRERPGQTLQTTALVHEAYLRLCKDEGAQWENRRHFFGAAANAMRRILIDNARQRAAEKREGERRRVTLDAGMASEETPLDLLALNEALDNLSTIHTRPSEVVKFRYFIGLTVKETAELLEVSPRTIDADWKLAKAWLLREMSGAA
jgi:RNA polymerase sigma factor (TIGR02999 family)